MIVDGASFGFMVLALSLILAAMLTRVVNSKLIALSTKGDWILFGVLSGVIFMGVMYFSFGG